MHPLLIETSYSDGVVSLQLNRPQQHHALNDALVHLFSSTLSRLSADPPRLLILQSEGPTFCAGGDLAEMEQMAGASFEENFKNAERLGALFYAWWSFPSPTLTVVQGHAFGGALGLIAASDFVLGRPEVQLCLSEVRLGLIPALISPYLSARLGIHRAKFLALSAQRFNGIQAHAYGLFDELSETPEKALELWVNNMLQTEPSAARAAKQLFQERQAPQLRAAYPQMARLLADIRTSEAAKHRLMLFLKPPDA